MEGRLFPTAVVVSIALHAALLPIGCDPPSTPAAPISPRDLRFFLAQIMPAGNEANPAPALSEPAEGGRVEGPPAAPEGDLDALPEGADGGNPGPKFFRYVHDVVAPRVYAQLRAPRRDAVVVVQIEITRFGDLAFSAARHRPRVDRRQLPLRLQLAGLGGAKSLL